MKKIIFLIILSFIINSCSILNDKVLVVIKNNSDNNLDWYLTVLNSNIWNSIYLESKKEKNIKIKISDINKIIKKQNFSNWNLKFKVWEKEYDICWYIDNETSTICSAKKIILNIDNNSSYTELE